MHAQSVVASLDYLPHWDQVTARGESYILTVTNLYDLTTFLSSLLHQFIYQMLTYSAALWPWSESRVGLGQTCFLTRTYAPGGRTWINSTRNRPLCPCYNWQYLSSCLGLTLTNVRHSCHLSTAAILQFLKSCAHTRIVYELSYWSQIQNCGG